ncbi:hypothetical protein [Paraburkholderia sp. J94]|uniref:hypothetical protein n=1 Tax=Paraburkholderia sp. J94 TaxID=2805441 RepID=UPI002AAFC4EB|nr:hypothetical protein [Paraburkholderia sp. J94]
MVNQRVTVPTDIAPEPGFIEICELRGRAGASFTLVESSLAAAPRAHAQMIGAAFASPLAKSRLQTAAQRKQSRAQLSSDPYMALVEQSSLDSYLRDIGVDKHRAKKEAARPAGHAASKPHAQVAALAVSRPIV